LKTLETKRLLIRPFTIDDLAEAHAMLDLDIQWAGPAFSLDQRRQALQFYIQLAQWGGDSLYGYRAITLKASSQLIGICGFLPVLWLPHTKSLFWPAFFGHSEFSPDRAYATLELEIGYALASQQRRQGYATEAVRALVDYAFRVLNVGRIFASTNRSNTGSIGLMRRIGMHIANNPEHPEVEWPGAPGVAGMIERHTWEAAPSGASNITDDSAHERSPL
jgi:RimJ/RimL family protein N-acetyltransferase